MKDNASLSDNKSSLSGDLSESQTENSQNRGNFHPWNAKGTQKMNHGFPIITETAFERYRTEYAELSDLSYSEYTQCRCKACIWKIKHTSYDQTLWLWLRTKIENQETSTTDLNSWREEIQWRPKRWSNEMWYYCEEMLQSDVGLQSGMRKTKKHMDHIPIYHLGIEFTLLQQFPFFRNNSVMHAYIWYMRGPRPRGRSVSGGQGRRPS